jgi:hypothetical protein
MINDHAFLRKRVTRSACCGFRAHFLPWRLEFSGLNQLREKIGCFVRGPVRPCVLFLLVFLLPCVARADVSVTITLDRREGTLVDSIRMVVSVSGTRSTESQPILHGLQSFHVTGGGTSSRVEIINGKVNAGVDYTYFIQPKKTGKFQIGPADVTVGGKAFRSNTVSMTVTEAAQASGVDRGPLFLSANLSSEQAYVEEQPICTVKLFRQMKVSDISLDLPETEHLVFKQLGKPLEYQSVFNGKTYQVLEVRYAVVPSKEGGYTIGPTRMTMTVYQPERRSSRGLFDDPFFRDPFFSLSSGRPMTLASESHALTVLPLPQAGRPADFSGLVGKFKIESKLEPATVKAGASATLTVLLSGRGNVNRIPDMKGPELSHTKVYADKPVLKVEPDAQGLAGSKTMKWALVPEKQGYYEIPPLSVSFFDTTTHQYRVAKTRPMSLSVLPGEPETLQASSQRANEGPSAEPAKQAVKELGRDILPVHTSVKALAGGDRVRPGRVSCWLVLMAPLFVYGATFWGLRFRRKTDQTVAAMKSRKAAGKLIKKCRQRGISSGELSLCIRDYLNERFGLALGSLTPEEGAEILRSKGVSLDTAQDVRAVLERLEGAVYTGRGGESGDIHEDVPKLIKQIAKEIR